MSDRIEHYVHHVESTTIINAPPTSVATGLEAREVIERLLARIDELILAGDGLAECVIPYRSNATRLAAWKKAKE